MENLPGLGDLLKAGGPFAGWASAIYVVSHFIRTRAEAKKIELSGSLDIYDRSAAREQALVARVTELEARLDARDDKELELMNTVSEQSKENRALLVRIRDLEKENTRLEKLVAKLEGRIAELEGKVNGNPTQ